MKKIAGLFLMFAILGMVANAGDVDQSIRRMLDRNDIKYKIDSDGDFMVGFTDGNTVTVNSNTTTYKNMTIRSVWTVLGAVGYRDQSFLYRMLKDNSEMKLGAFAIAEQEGKVYALYMIKVSSDASWQDLWRAILFCRDVKLPE